MKGPLISVIVPVYNVEQYLLRCLDSIASQTYQNLEAILVDDGSTDCSGLICDEYCLKDSRFRVIHQENRWLSGARNTGLDAAKGEFVCFVDSDDYVSPYYIETLLDGLSTGADLSVIGFEMVNEDGSVFKGAREEIPSNSIKNKEEILKLLIDGIGMGAFTFGVVWNKLYARSLIGDTRFGPFFSLEDAPFNLAVYSKISTAFITNVKAYFYVQRPGSIMGGACTNYPKIAYHRFKALTEMLASVPEEEARIKEMMLRKVFSTHVLGYRSGTFGTGFEEAMNEAFRETWKKYGRRYLKDCHIPIKERAVISLGWWSPFFWDRYWTRNRNN